MKKFLFIFMFFLIFFTASDLYSQRLKFGSFQLINAKPADMAIVVPNYGFSAGLEMKYLYLSLGLSSTIFSFDYFGEMNFSFYFDAGPRLPLYSSKNFNFSIPLSFRLSYLNYPAEAGDGYLDEISRLLLGGSVNLNFDWEINKFGVYFFVSAYFLGQVIDDSKYFETPPTMVDNTRAKLYIGIQTGSGISYNF